MLCAPSAPPRPPSVTASAASPSASAARITASAPARPARLLARLGRSANSTRTVGRATSSPPPRASPPVAPAPITSTDGAGRASTSWRCRPSASSRGPRPPGPGRQPARARQLHAKNARQAIAEAKALPAEARRHLAEIAPARHPPARRPSSRGLAARRRPPVLRRRLPPGRLRPRRPHRPRRLRNLRWVRRRIRHPDRPAIPNFCESCVRQGGDA